MGRGGTNSSAYMLGIGSTEHGVYSGRVMGFFHTKVYALWVSAETVLGTWGWVFMEELGYQGGHLEELWGLGFDFGKPNIRGGGPCIRLL